MKRFILVATAATVLAWSAAAQTAPGSSNPEPQTSPGAQSAPQSPDVPITGQGNQQNHNPQRGEDAGQQGKGVPVAGQPQPQPKTAQSSEGALPPNAEVPVSLSKTIDAKKAKEGDEVLARTTQDLINQGSILLPRGTRIIGHVAAAKPRAKGENESELGLAWDKAVLKDGREVPLHAIIQAVAAPQRLAPMQAGDTGAENSGAPDSPGAQGGMAGTMGNPGAIGNPGAGNPRGQVGGEPSGAAGNPGGIASPSGAQTQQPAAQGSSSGGVLTERSSGVQGMPGVMLKVNQQGTSLLTDQQGNLKLEGGTRLLLRLVQ